MYQFREWSSGVESNSGQLYWMFSAKMSLQFDIYAPLRQGLAIFEHLRMQDEDDQERSGTEGRFLGSFRNLQPVPCVPKPEQNFVLA